MTTSLQFVRCLLAGLERAEENSGVLVDRERVVAIGRSDQTKSALLLVLGELPLLIAGRQARFRRAASQIW